MAAQPCFPSASQVAAGSRMPRMIFTQESVDRLRLEPGKQEERWTDASPDAPTLGIRLRRVSTGIQRIWIVQHRYNGEQRTYQVGSLAEINLKEARAASKRYHAALVLDRDPKAAKRAEKVARAAAAEEQA